MNKINLTLRKSTRKEFTFHKLIIEYCQKALFYTKAQFYLYSTESLYSLFFKYIYLLLVNRRLESILQIDLILEFHLN